MSLLLAKVDSCKVRLALKFDTPSNTQRFTFHVLSAKQVTRRTSWAKPSRRKKSRGQAQLRKWAGPSRQKICRGKPVRRRAGRAAGSKKRQKNQRRGPTWESPMKPNKLCPSNFFFAQLCPQPPPWKALAAVLAQPIAFFRGSFDVALDLLRMFHTVQLEHNDPCELIQISEKTYAFSLTFYEATKAYHDCQDGIVELL